MQSDNLLKKPFTVHCSIKTHKNGGFLFVTHFHRRGRHEKHNVIKNIQQPAFVVSNVSHAAHMRRPALRMRLMKLDLRSRTREDKPRMRILDQMVDAVVEDGHADAAVKIAANQRRPASTVGGKQHLGKFIFDVPRHVCSDDAKSRAGYALDLGVV